MRTKILSILAAMSFAAVLGITASAEGGVAKIGDVQYDTIADAISNANEGDTVKLISDIDGGGSISINKSITLDGGGHTISGDTDLSAGSDKDITITNVNFRNIHNDINQKSPIYGSKLSNKLTITNCGFYNADWDCIQITPVAGAEIVITDNIFKPDSTTPSKRFVHIQSAENVDFFATVKNNKMYNTANLIESALEVYYFTDPGKIDLTGNYIENPNTSCILRNYGTNVSDMIYPVYVSDEMNELYTPAAYGLTTYYIIGADTIDEVINGETQGEKASSIKLAKDIAEDVVIPAGRNITLDLNGHTLTNVSDHTITNNGTLTIKDSSAEKTGTVDNITHQKAAVYNAPGATAALSGGNYIRSKEADNTPENSGGNSYYVILNQGTMTISSENVSVTSTGAFSSLIDNGWYNGKENTSGTPSILKITSGTFSGGINTIKNDDYGELTISGGTFSNITQHVVMNWNVANISGGTFDSGNGYSIVNNYGDETMDKGILNITGGSFEGSVVNSNQYTGGTITVSGGTFANDVTTYLADGCAVSSGEKYIVMNPANDTGKVTNAGAYKSAVKDGSYDQMNIFEETLSGQSVKYTVISSDDTTEAQTIEVEYTGVESTAKFGLIITDIPVDKTVTIELAQ